MYRSRRSEWLRAVITVSGVALFACSSQGTEGPVDRFGRSLAVRHADLPVEEGLTSTALALAGDSLFGPAQSIDVGSRPDAVAVGDVTGDGRNDVVLTTTYSFDDANDYRVFVFPQLADGTLGPASSVPYVERANRTGLVLADLDGDDAAEIVVGHGQGITIVNVDTAGVAQPNPLVVTAPRSADTLSALDIDLDGHLDLVALSWSSGATIFLGDGAGGIRSQYHVATHASGYNDQETADLDGDGQTDLAVMSGQTYATPNLSVHRQTGAGTLDAPQTYRVGDNQLTRGIGTGDIDGDGLDDVVLSGTGNRPTQIWVYRQDGQGRLAGPTPIDTYDIPETVEVADVNNDGGQDVVVLHGGWLRMGVYLQDCAGELGAEQLFEIPYASHYSPQGLSVGDVDGDGCPDAAIADDNHGLVLLYGRSCEPPRPPAQPLSGLTAEASSTWYPPYYAASRAVDGNLSTFWVGGIRQRPWQLTIDLNQTAEVETLELDWYPSYGSPDYDVEVSTDHGQSYRKVAEHLTTADGEVTSAYLLSMRIPIDSESVTQVRVTIHHEAYYFPVIREARVLGWSVAQ